MKRVTGWVTVLGLALVACATAGTPRQEPESGLPTAPPESQGAISDHGPTTDTFDGWILYGDERRQVFVATLTGIVDEEPWETDSAYPTSERELSFVVREVIKGRLAPDEEVSVFQHEHFGARARLLPRDIGRDVLVLAGVIPRIRSAEGDRDHPNALSMIVAASYVRMEDPDGRAVGVRLVSPVAERFGYDGSRATLEERLRERLPLRLADVSPWDALLERAADPRTVREEQLGYEEFAEAEGEPAEYDYGDPDTDDEEDA